MRAQTIGPIRARHSRRLALVALLLLAALVPLRPRPLAAEPSCGKGGFPRLDDEDPKFASTPVKFIGGVVLFRTGGYDAPAWYRIPEAYDESKPSPLLIVLPGTVDIGNVLFNAFDDMLREERDPVWKRTIILQLNALGKNWLDGKKEHTAFLEMVLEKMQGAYNIDRDRIVLAGWSAGAVFLGNFIAARPRTFAASFHGVGGGLWGRGGLPSHAGCKMNAFFAIGTRDFMYKQTRSQVDWLKAQGHNVVLKAEKGKDHDAGVMLMHVRGAYEFIKKQTRCGKIVPGSC